MNGLNFVRLVLVAFLLSVVGVAAFAKEADDQRVIAKWVAENSHVSVGEAEASRIVKAAYKAAKSWGVDPLLLLAVMKPESNFRAGAKNRSSKASGLMQVIPKYHYDKIGKRQIMQVETNVDVGAAIIAEYLSLSKGKLQKAIARYSGGASKTYHGKIADAYRGMKAALVLDRFVDERPHRTDHIYQQPGAYTASLQNEEASSVASVRQEPEKFFAVLVASHP